MQTHFVPSRLPIAVCVSEINLSVSVSLTLFVIQMFSAGLSRIQ